MTNRATFGTIFKLVACVLGGALASVVVLAGAILAACFAFALVLAQALRPLAIRLPLVARKDAEAPSHAGAVGRTASVSVYYPTA